MAAVGIATIDARSLSREEEFGLWLHVNRVSTRRATEVASGVSVAFGTGPLKKDWFAAIACDDSEAEEMMFAANAARAEARAMRKYRMGQ